MKTLIPICIILCFLFITCKGITKDDVQDFIPGTYVRFSEHEFGKEYDTLVISELKDQYKITRKWKYERILDSVAQEPEYKQEITTASYESEHKLLHENETGNILSFDPGEKVLFIGPTKYQKLK
ncbi:MAG TPA: hypothetical protein VJ765_08380 [Chitinophagaceae bacterium]|nr:hypothetical protein [Chitinophagaceae bacterium]